ncbi:MAG: reverse transcriptase/maturase family protein [Candidatus Liptonbacteria bacterium]
MRHKIHPQQISLFDSRENRDLIERERITVTPGHAYDDIISVENLLSAWREFLRGKRRRKDVAVFSLNLTGNILALHRELADKTYRHGPYHAFKINDPKPRDIHKAEVRDRLVHHAIYRILYPYFDRTFVFDSYSCRLDKGTYRAMNRFRQYAGIVSRNHTRTVWVLKGDIRKFFASIDHEVLKNILNRRIEDSDTLWLLGEIIDSFSAKGRSGVGLPLGNLTSQLLANIYMNELDQFMKRKLKIRYCIRYADDFIIVHEDRRYLESILPAISTFLNVRLKLSLHPNKVFVKTFASGVDFLGWVHFPHHRTLRSATKRRVFKRLAANPSDETRASYRGLLGHGNAHKLAKKLFVG